jgi:Tol biopolymer transport system component
VYPALPHRSITRGGSYGRRNQTGRKYERNGWPSIKRPDIKPPEDWSLELITAVNRVRDHQLSPDGKNIAFIWDREDLSDVYVMPAAGGWPARISTQRGPVAYWDDEIPQWSPDSRWLAFTMQWHVHVAPLAGGLPKKISGFAPKAMLPRWMPDSHGLLVFVDREGEGVQLLLTDREGCWPRSLVTLPGDVRDARPAPDGKTVVFIFRPRDDPNRLDLRLVDVQTGQIRPLTGAPKQKDWWPRWSPDGSLIAFLSQRSGFNEVWPIRSDGEGIHPLTHLGMDVSDLAWSPDGTRLACTVNREGAFDLALIDVASGDVNTLRTGQGIHSSPHWSPDCKYLTFEYETPLQVPDIYRVSVSGGKISQLTFSNLPALAWPITRWSCPNGHATRVTMGWKFRPCCSDHLNRTAQQSYTHMAALLPSIVTNGISWPSTSLPRVTPSSRPTTGGAAVTGSSLNTPTTMTGALATRKIAFMERAS